MNFTDQYAGSDIVMPADAPYAEDRCEELTYRNYSLEALEGRISRLGSEQRMSGPKLALLAGSVAAALLAALWWQHRRGVTLVEPAAISADVVAASRDRRSKSPRPFVAAPPTAAVPAPPQAAPTGMRANEAELRARAAQESYARIGDVLVDHLVARGLARADGELVVRRSSRTTCAVYSTRCMRRPMHNRSPTISVLDALEAELYDSDGPLLGGLVDLRAVQNRVVPCALGAAQQAGIEESALPETTRAALIRRAR